MASGPSPPCSSSKTGRWPTKLSARAASAILRPVSTASRREPPAGVWLCSSRPGSRVQGAEFVHQLAQLSSAGVGFIQALEQIKRSPPSRSYREPLQGLLNELDRGA